MISPNQALIDYQNQLLQKNLDDISVITFQIANVRDAITYSQETIEMLNQQIIDFNSQIDEISAGNALINETIVILAA